MRSLIIISLILTLNTLLVLAAASSWKSNKKSPPPVDAKTFSDCINNSPTTYPQLPFSNIYSAAVDREKFTAVLNSTARNFRLLEDSVSKPNLIIRPNSERQVPAAVLCAQRYKLNVRIRGGGHDYEGLSFASFIKNQQFMILDLYNLRKIEIKPDGTAWVQSGATNGELYYKISQFNRTLGFPAGICTTLGMGAHTSGGGYGFMMRQFGLAADNVLDVRMVDAWGIVRSREYWNMDDNLFWALSGGGGGNFGVILAWQIKLVPVPWNVTVFTSVIPREAGGAEILQKWQRDAPSLDSRLFIRVLMQTIPLSATTKTVLSIYQAVFLGSAKDLVSLMRTKLPELGVTSVKNCTEMSWIEAVVSIAGYPVGTTPDYLLQAKPAFLVDYLKSKSDYLRKVMPINAINGLLDIFEEQAGTPSLIIWNLYGGKMAVIPEWASPFPHREGVICNIQYAASWVDDSSPGKQLEMEDWMRVMYEYMTPYVSKNPREAYVNYRDLDIGKKLGSNSSCPEIWGHKYFKGNYQRLVFVKSLFDPDNFFSNEQSIPTFWNQKKCTQVI